MGKKDYPWSAKLNTIKMQEVAFDIFEIKRNMREFYKEQFTKSLNIIKKDDDFSEMIFKMFEQIRLLNSELQQHLDIQESKKSSIRNLERVLIHESDYQHLLSQLKAEDKQLYEISVGFSEITKEAKRILDDIKAKSEKRKQDFGVGEHDAVNNHHRVLPASLTEELSQAVGQVSCPYSDYFRSMDFIQISKDSPSRPMTPFKTCRPPSTEWLP